MVRELEAVPLRDLHLATLDRRVNELDDLTAVGAHDVVVVFPGIQFEDRVTFREVVPDNEPRRLEWHEHRPGPRG